MRSSHGMRSVLLDGVYHVDGLVPHINASRVESARKERPRRLKSAHSGLADAVC